MGSDGGLLLSTAPAGRCVFCEGDQACPCSELCWGVTEEGHGKGMGAQSGAWACEGAGGRGQARA